MAVEYRDLDSIGMEQDDLVKRITKMQQELGQIMHVYGSAAGKTIIETGRMREELERLKQRLAEVKSEWTRTFLHEGRSMTYSDSEAGEYDEPVDLFSSDSDTESEPEGEDGIQLSPSTPSPPLDPILCRRLQRLKKELEWTMH